MLNVGYVQITGIHPALSVHSKRSGKMLFENLNPVSIDSFNNLGPLELSMSFPLVTACFSSSKALLFDSRKIEKGGRKS